MIAHHRFAIATRDELWSLGATRALLESRLSHGAAEMRESELIATDARDEELLARCEARIASARAAVDEVADARLRIVVAASAVPAVLVRETLVVTRGAISIVTDREHLTADLQLLDDATEQQQRELVEWDARLPIVWRHGSAAVLLHEAVGHAAEHGKTGGEWPAWLRVHDQPDVAFDDTGAPARSVDLLREAPACLRRESFRDVPLPRMTRVVVTHEGAPFEMPSTRIEVRLLSGGVYDPLNETVSLFITHAERIDGDDVRRVLPFELRASRADVARSLVGATGAPRRYPGVICSREGQEIVVGCDAPLLVTSFG